MSEKKVFDLPEIRGRLIQFREKLKINPNAFASSIKINGSNYAAMEKGGKPLGENTVIKIVKIYDLNPSWLYFGEGPMYNRDKEASSARVQPSQDDANIQARLSLEELKAAVNQLEEDLSLPKISEEDRQKIYENMAGRAAARRGKPV